MSLATIHKTGLYAIVTLIGIVVAVLAAYYVLVEFVYPLKSADIAPVESFSGITQARGTIIAIARDSESVGTTTLVTIIAAGDEHLRVRIPHNPSVQCRLLNTVDPAGLAVGDTLDVKGAVDDTGDIVPCKEPEHHVVLVASATPEVVEEVVVASSTASTTLESIDSVEMTTESTLGN
jgi:hypothetical protein